MAGVENGGVSGPEQGAEDVHARLRNMILQGELVPGSSASQVELAKRLGVSRTPLREALRMLQREGLVHTEPNRRLRIAPFSLGDLEQLYIMRVTLESAAIRLTIPRLSSEAIAGMEGNLAQMAHFGEQDDFERWEVPHRSFHHTLVGGAGERIYDTLAQLSDHAERYRRFYMSQRPETFRRAVASDHRLILDAAKEKDTELGSRRLAAHLCRTVFSVVDIVDVSYGAQALREILGEIVGREDPL